MESLYRKYRPQTFADVVGQTHVISTLEHAVVEGRTSHAYLFCGPRGTGKTTMARILSKALLCERGEKHLPDGTCEQCEMIAIGEHPDVFELDAASRTSVENVREEIISTVSFAPVIGRKKIYIIDEVHMLTKAAFNALLKTLEEPPDHVVFIMCTTDPQMIPQTILSRLQRFDFKAIGPEDIKQRLKYVCEAEGFSAEPEALDLIVASAKGGMRDALSSLEQLSVFGAGEITYKDACDMLGASSTSRLSAALEALANRDIAELFLSVDTALNQGQDLMQYCKDLTSALRDVYIVSCTDAPEALMALAGNIQETQRLAGLFKPEDISYFLHVLGDTIQKIRYSTSPRLELEIAFTRIVNKQSDSNLDALYERIAQLEDKLARIEKQGALTASVPVSNVKLSQTHSLPTVPAHKNPVRQEMGLPSKIEPIIMPKVPKPQSRQTAQTASSEPHSLEDCARLWSQAISTIRSARGDIAELLSMSQVVQDDGSALIVELPTGSSFASLLLERPDVRAIITPEITKLFGARRLTFTCDHGQAKAKTASPARVRGDDSEITAVKVPSVGIPAVGVISDQETGAVQVEQQMNDTAEDLEVSEASSQVGKELSSQILDTAEEVPHSMSVQHEDTASKPSSAAAQMEAEPAASEPNAETVKEEKSTSIEEMPPWEAAVPSAEVAGLSEDDAALYNMVAQTFGEGVKVVPADKHERG